ncbi:2-haloalkanoic acid dehalogenase [Sulfodiicoccus acidiphilus]|uniref:2-haloalkanoic acid dehalogenase n=1 Tax=Sulfodiicoccus acidiphilus TaxID=1670455 RepID=A0A348B135_9CREN|nr:2-haloalkanoic acid dehalogenase [Sulfodiicoccus acidiphilus]GGT91220.1 2-haloalkanoic acid dehalogenase [Sulfodiicoccus acidiphilus]
MVDFESSSTQALKLVAKEATEYLREIGDFKLSLEEKMLAIAKDLDASGVYDRVLWWEKALEELNLKADPELLFEWTSLYWSVASKNEPYEDALDVVEYLKRKGYKLGLVTNTDGRGGNKLKRVSSFPLISAFDLILIGGENDLKPKPNLQIFVEACERLGGAGEWCVMIGDDPVKDTIPAKKAGILSVLVDRRGIHRNPELYADFVVSNLKELEDLL